MERGFEEVITSIVGGIGRGRRREGRREEDERWFRCSNVNPLVFGWKNAESQNTKLDQLW